MFISASEAVNSESSTDGNKSNNSEEAMPAIMSSNSNSLLSSKRSACSASAADCYNMSLGAGPLWWS